MERKIICPYCRHEYETVDMEDSPNDLWGICPSEERVEEECVSCGNVFIVQGGYTPEYRMYQNELDYDLANN